mmetsp:Transcript_63642/g.152158  ORF Transcript_63642/g.152158 Transcript_63642/m.152158 type:complete len:249 (-) Transcript_63642:2186-2932(-)
MNQAVRLVQLRHQQVEKHDRHQDREQHDTNLHPHGLCQNLFEGLIRIHAECHFEQRLHSFVDTTEILQAVVHCRNSRCEGDKQEDGSQQEKENLCQHSATHQNECRDLHGEDAEVDEEEPVQEHCHTGKYCVDVLVPPVCTLDGEEAKFFCVRQAMKYWLLCAHEHEDDQQDEVAKVLRIEQIHWNRDPVYALKSASLDVFVEESNLTVENAAHAAKIDEDSTAKRRNTLFESRIGFSKDCLACDENT